MTQPDMALQQCMSLPRPQLTSNIWRKKHSYLLRSLGRHKPYRCNKLSDYAFQVITSLVMSKWGRNGYRNCTGEAVVNGDGFRQLDLFVEDLEADGIVVPF